MMRQEPSYVTIDALAVGQLQGETVVLKALGHIDVVTVHIHGWECLRPVMVFWEGKASDAANRGRVVENLFPNQWVLLG